MARLRLLGPLSPFSRFVVKRRSHWFLACALLALPADCAQLAKVTEKRPELGAPQESKAQLSPAEQAINAASKVQRTNPTRALGTYVAAAKAASTQLRRMVDDL